MSGARTPSVLGRIVLPLVAGGLLNAWIWIALLAYREVTMALALYTRDNVVVATVVWVLWGEGRISQVAALGVVLVLGAVVVAAAVRTTLRRITDVGWGS